MHLLKNGYNCRDTEEAARTLTPEVAAKIGAANRGKVRTPDMRAHMSSVKKGQGKGRVKTPEEIAKQVASKKAGGYVPGPETRQKMSSALKGVPWSPARREAQNRKKAEKEHGL